MAKDDVSPTATVTAIGVPNMTRAANKPPRTPIPTFMRKAPLHSDADPHPDEPTDSLWWTQLVANFATPANLMWQRDFIFIPRRCPSATS